MSAERTKIDARQHLDWVKATDIEMAPPQWGRPLHQGYVRNIAAGFDPDMVGALCVWFRRDLLPGRGRYVLIDGQHRLAAIRLMGWSDQRVPCLIYEGLNMETAAELSLGLQERRNLHALDAHRAALAAHERRAIEIDKVLSHLGLQLVYSSRPTELRRVSAVGQVGVVWDLMESAGLERVLSICDEAWEGTCAGFGAGVLKLVTILVAAHNGSVDDSALAQVLSARSPAQWLLKDMVPRRPLVSIAQDVIVEYNKRRRGPNRLPELTPSEYITAARRPSAPTVKGPIEGNVVANTDVKVRRRRGT